MLAPSPSGHFSPFPVQLPLIFFKDALSCYNGYNASVELFSEYRQKSDILVNYIMYAGLVIIPNLCLHTQAFPSIPWELRPRILPTERIPTNTYTNSNSIWYFFRFRAYTRKGSVEITFFRPYIRKFWDTSWPSMGPK